MQASHSERVITCFCVAGIGNKLLPLSQDIAKQRSLTSIELLQVQLPDDFPIKENEKWLDLNGQKDFWLRAIFDQQDKPAITFINVVEFKQEEDLIKVPLKDDLQPCQIKRKFDQQNSQFKGISNGFSLYAGNFDLSPILNVAAKKNHQIVLCFQTQNQLNFSQPICEMLLMKADKIDKMKFPQIQSEMKLIIPKDFSAVNFGFGLQARDRYLIFKQKLSPLKIAYSPRVLDQYPLEDVHDSPLTHLVNMVPMFCFPQGVSLIKSDEDPISLGQTAFKIIFTSEAGHRTYCTCLTFYEHVPAELISQLGHFPRDNGHICYPKAICLISSYNYPDQMRELAKYIYRSSLSKNHIPIESTICSIVNKIKFPKATADFENVVLSYQLPSQDITFPTNFKYPVNSNESLNCLLQLLDVNKILILYTAILQERKIHLISNHISVPGMVIDAFLQLLFPFEFTSVLISTLPDSLRSYIEAPVPFIIGYSQRNIIDQNQHTQVDSIYAYLDTNFVMNGDHITPLPEKLQKKLAKRLKVFSKIFSEDSSKSYLLRADHAYQMHAQDLLYDPESQKQIDFDGFRNIFLELNVELISGYRKFIKVQKKGSEGDFKETFNVDGFLEYHNQKKRDTFLSQFMDTRFFQYFIQERTNLSQQESSYQFFDKCIELHSKNKNARLVPPYQPKKVFVVTVPEEDQMAQRYYEYDRFPNLSAQLLQKFEQSENEDSRHELQQEELPQVESMQWPYFLMEVIHQIWFQLLIIKTRICTDIPQFQAFIQFAIQKIEEMEGNNLNISEKIFRHTMEACGYFVMEEAAMYLVKLMKKLKKEALPSTHWAYFQAVAQAMNITRPGNEGDQDQEPVGTRNVKWDKLENCVFKLTNSCPVCFRQLYFEEILDQFRNNQFGNQIQCVKRSQNNGCGNEFVPKMQITMFMDDNPIDAESVDLYQPVQILKDLQSIIKLKGETFVMSDLFEKLYRPLFLNCIFYLRLLKLPYFFILPQLNSSALVLFIQDLNKQPTLSQKKEKNIFKQITREIDNLIKSKDDSSSGSHNSSTRQDFKQSVNYGSKYTKRVFSQLIADLQEPGHKVSAKSSLNQFQSLQQFDEVKQESPSRKY